MLIQDDAALVCQRHRGARCYLTLENGDWAILEAQCGDLQGDQAASDKFTYVYDKRIVDWTKLRRRDCDQNTFLVREPHTGIEVDLSWATYADDMERMAVIPEVKGSAAVAS
eukprot:6232498-Pyramimonas_sp.AAC.1